MMREYLVKLVRDRIGEHLGRDKVVYKQVPRSELDGLLRKKIVEEALEYALEPSLDELADVYEAILGICDEKHWRLRDVQQAALVKFERRGGFQDGMGMYCVTTDPEFDSPEQGRMTSWERHGDYSG